MNKFERDRIEQKRLAAVEVVKRIAPHAEHLFGILDETKLDMLLLALNVGRVEIEPAE